MRILLIVNPERSDIYSYLKAIPGAEWILLWYEKPGQMEIPLESLPVQFKEVYYWTQFSTPNQLLNAILPDRIIFFEIIDLRQIALNVTARVKNIKSFYLEHGAAGDKETAIERWKEIEFTKHKLPYLIKRFKNSLQDIIRSKIFYYSVIKGFHSVSSYLKYFLLPLKMLRNAPNKVLSLNIFTERVPGKAIVFNEANYEEFSLYTGIKRGNALFTGIPYFDEFFKTVHSEKRYVIYVDSPYMEENLCGWTKQHHKLIAKTLYDFARQKQIPLYIKLHPRSNVDLWLGYENKPDNVSIIQKGNYTDLYLESNLILGYSSSLLNGFLCARKNVVLLGWHPKPFIFGADFSATGLCHLSLSIEDLHTKFDKWVAHNLTMENAEAYEAFLKRFNYPFDGKATERVIKAITEDEIS